MGDVTLRYLLFGEDKTASKALKGVGAQADKTGRKIDGFGSRAAGALGTLGKVAGGVALTGIAALGAGVWEGVKAAGRYETLAKKTAAVLTSTGNAAKQSVQGIQDRAAALESMSGVDEELIINGQNVLMTFTNITDAVGDGNQIFTRATESALDMSVALGTDLQSANIQLGKALNDPIKGITALSRVGVSFTKQQKDQIKTLVKSGRTMDAQKIILDELAKEFGGTAKAAGDTFEGSLKRAEDAVSDMGREVGKELLPPLTGLANWVAREGAPRLGQLINWIKGVGAAIMPVAREWLPKIGNALALVGNWVVNKVIPPLKQLGERVLAGLVAAWGHVSRAIEEHKPTLLAIGATLKTIAEWIMANVVPVIGTILGKAFDLLGKAIGKAIEVVAKIHDAFKAVAKVGIWLWNNALAPVVRMILHGFANLTSGIAKFLRALGNIPGFEWAARAADKMDDAADEARRLATNIRNIPDASVEIEFYFSQATINRMRARVEAALGGRVEWGRFASGGTNIPAQFALVGERGPELMYIPGGSTIYPADETRRILSGGPAQTQPLRRSAGGPEGGVQPIALTVMLDSRTLLQGVLRANRATRQLVVRAGVA